MRAELRAYFRLTGVLVTIAVIGGAYSSRWTGPPGDLEANRLTIIDKDGRKRAALGLDVRSDAHDEWTSGDVGLVLYDLDGEEVASVVFLDREEGGGGLLNLSSRKRANAFTVRSDNDEVRWDVSVDGEEVLRFQSDDRRPMLELESQFGNRLQIGDGERFLDDETVGSLGIYLIIKSGDRRALAEIDRQGEIHAYVKNKNGEVVNTLGAAGQK